MVIGGQALLAAGDVVGVPGAGPVARTILWLFVLWVGVQLGGGLYEKQVVIPMWAGDPTPQTLSRRLRESGMQGAAFRFWAFVSPVVFLLAVANAVAAWRVAGPARPYWLFSAVAMIAVSCATYGYFVPTMITKLWRAETLPPEQVARTLRLWVGLSWLRLAVSVPGWLAAIKALTLLR